MKTMKKTCTTFLLAFVMLLACIFPIFSAKDVKKASATSTYDTVYYFSDSYYPILDESKIAETINSYYIKSFKPSTFAAIFATQNPTNLFSVSDTEYTVTNVGATEYEFPSNSFIIFEFLVEKPVEYDFLSFLNALGDIDVKIITAHPLSSAIQNNVAKYEEIPFADNFLSEVLQNVDVTANNVYFIDRRLLGLRVDEVTVNNCFSHPFIKALVAKIQGVEYNNTFWFDQQILQGLNVAIFVSKETIEGEALELSLGLSGTYYLIESRLLAEEILSEDITSYTGISYYYSEPVMYRRMNEIWADYEDENTLSYILEVNFIPPNSNGIPASISNKSDVLSDPNTGNDEWIQDLLIAELF